MGRVTDLRRRFSPGRAWATLLLAMALLCALGQWWLPPGSSRQALAFILLWLLPAGAWLLWLGDYTPRGLVMAAGLALLGNVVAALLLQMLPGAIPRWQLALLALATTALPLVLPGEKATTPGSPPGAPAESRVSDRRRSRQCALLLVAVILFAAFLRVANIGYKELQGDEGVVMMRAAAVLQGDEGELFIHEKGPVEILLPLLQWGLAGSTNEAWARAPFLWAGWLSVIAIFSLTRRWFSYRAGLLAALLFALNGFSVAFSRIVQYQSLVMLWGILALLFATRYRERGRARDLLFVALFLAGGLLAHYDALLVVPTVAWLLFTRLWQTRTVDFRAWLVALLGGAAITALFYIPYLSNPAFVGTGRYLLQDRLGGTLFSWSGAEVWQMVTFYNSTYYLLGLSALALLGLWLCRQQPYWFAALLLAGVPAFFYLSIVADPRTHVYTLAPGAAILAGAGAASLAERVPTPATRRVAGTLFALFALISAVYIFLLFVDVTPERQRTWALNRPPLYPVTWEEPPLYGLFGFPHQAGWRLAPDLVQAFPYASNEEAEITNWYMAQAPRTHCADYATFLLAENTQDEIPYNTDELQDLFLQHIITVNARPSLRIFGSQPVAQVQQHEAADRQLWRTPQEVAPVSPDFEHSVGVNLEGNARLLGYDLEPEEIRPGERLTVILYWESLAPFAQNYQVFVHLYDGTMWAQNDSAPECGINPTTRWEPGQFIRDPHIIELPADLPPGRSIPILVGMYELVSGDRLHVGETDADSILLTAVRVTEEAP